MFRCLAQFIYGTEFQHKDIRTKIYQEALNRINILPNVIIETERGKFKMHDYINTIKEDGNQGGDVELSIAYDIFNFNIDQYLVIRDSSSNTINLSFVKYINNENNEQKYLLILVNENHIHYNIAYYNNTIVDLNYLPPQPNNAILQFDTKTEKKANNIDNSLNKYQFKDLSSLTLENILKLYNKNNDNQNENNDNLADIYYYIYHYNLSKNKEGKYSKDFSNKYKSSKTKLRKAKKLFKKRIIGYNIGADKRLRKFVEIKDKINDTKVTHNLIIVPYSETEKIMEFYHKKTGHKNYLVLHEKILLEGYYWKRITVSCKNFVKNCEISIMKNKSTFIILQVIILYVVIQENYI